VVRDTLPLPNGDVIAVGSFTTAGGVAANRIAHWNGTSWSAYGAGVNGPETIALQAVAALPSGEILVGGEFATAGDVDASHIARWNGAAWSAIGAGTVIQQYDRIWACTTLPNGDLVVGGSFAALDGVSVNKIARWNGSSWTALGSGMGGLGAVFALAVLPNGDLVAGGQFTSAGGVPANCIARWDGSSWSALGSSIGALAGASVLSLAVLPNGDLVAGGFFTSAGGVPANCIARWDGSAWWPLGSGFNTITAKVRALAVLPNGDLIAAGNFLTAGGVPAKLIARWNGSTWSALGSGLTTQLPYDVNALAVLPNGDLIAGGNFPAAMGFSAGIARWNGTTWSSVGSGVNGAVNALAVLEDGALVAGGSFTTAGGTTANRVARWHEFNWTPLGLGLNNEVRALTLLPNEELVVGGRFTTAGGVASLFLARWTDSGTPLIARQPNAFAAGAGAKVALSAECVPGYDFAGPVTFQWRRDGVDVEDGEGGASKGGGAVSGASGALTATGLSTTLTIADTQASDAGEYTVVFTNSCGSATSIGATVTVATPCPADLDGDGEVGATDLAALLSGWGVSGSPADIDGSGTVDSVDLAALLNAWGACG
jgi:hypothetical protein